MNEPMNAQSFARLLKSRPDMLDDANAFAAVLREAYPGEKGSVNLMITAYNAGVVPMLRGGSSGERLLTRIMIPLTDDYGITEEKARWAAELWRDAYAAATSGGAVAKTSPAAPSLPETDPSCFEVWSNDTSCTVTRYTGPETGTVVIPAKIDGMTVTKIGYCAFRGYGRGLTGIIIPDSVTEIEDEAFEDCESLTDLTIPRSVKKIGKRAFESCRSLTSVVIPDGVTYINQGTFFGCRSLSSVTIPNSVTGFGWKAFCACHNLTSVTIPNSVTTIGEQAFSGCPLTSVTIPDSVTTIGSQAFCACKELTSVIIPSSVKKIDREAFSYCKALFSIIIPDSVTEIGWGAFGKCSPALVIHAPAGSAAEAYAKENHIEFQAI